VFMAYLPATCMSHTLPAVKSLALMLTLNAEISGKTLGLSVSSLELYFCIVQLGCQNIVLNRIDILCKARMNYTLLVS